MIRHVLFRAVCWALLASLGLCFAEVLTHPCRCATETDCGHEGDCASEPHHQMAVVRGGRGCCGDVAAPVSPIACGPAIVPAEAAPIIPALRLIRPPPPQRPNLPYAESDRPLRL